MATLAKEQLKRIAALHDRKVRRVEGLFIAEGLKVCEELLASDLQIEQWVVQTGAGLSTSMMGFDSIEVSRSQMERISAMSHPPGVLCVARIPQSAFIPSLKGISLYLDGISDPGNMGTIIRLADWFGVSEVYLSPDCTDPYSPKVVQSAMGSLFRLRINMVDADPVIMEYLEHDLPVIGSSLDGVSLRESGKVKNGLLVIGSESHGISQKVLARCSSTVTIAKAEGSLTESLNAATATAILLYHLTQP